VYDIEDDPYLFEGEEKRIRVLEESLLHTRQSKVARRFSSQSEFVCSQWHAILDLIRNNLRASLLITQYSTTTISVAPTSIPTPTRYLKFDKEEERLTRNEVTQQTETSKTNRNGRDKRKERKGRRAEARGEACPSSSKPTPCSVGRDEAETEEALDAVLPSTERATGKAKLGAKLSWQSPVFRYSTTAQPKPKPIHNISLVTYSPLRGDEGNSVIR
jgi:hypothetical protein